MNWKTHLTPDEAARIAELENVQIDASLERRRIWDRCRKRMAKARADSLGRVK